MAPLRMWMVISVLLLWQRDSLSAAYANSLAGEQDDSDVNIDTYSSKSEAHPVYSNCQEDDGIHFPIIERKVWESPNLPLRTNLPVEYLVVRDGGKRCKSHHECVAVVSAERKVKSFSNECRTLENFYVSESGHVYEGRGWDVAPYWHLNGLRTKSATVQFLGSHRTEGPSQKAVDAFKKMIRVGMWQGKLWTHSRVVSMGQIYNDSSLVGNALEEILRKWKTWKDVDPMSTWEILPRATLSLIGREDWDAEEPTAPISKVKSPVEFVLITEGGDRCFTREDCASRVRAEQATLRPQYGDLFENFYVGEDGNVYEGRGFDVAPMWQVRGLKNNYITVRLFGNFKEELPSENAIHALKILVNTGVWTGKISPRYKLYSLRGIYDEEKFLGDKLLTYAQKWNPWAKKIDELSSKNRETQGFLPLINRVDWGANDENITAEVIEHPVDHVMIMALPMHERCFKWTNCMETLKTMQEEGDFKENFYVGDDGNVYEGRGWDLQPHLQIKYFNESIVSIRFIGNFRRDRPSLPAVLAFESLVRLGVKSGKISPNYQLYSFGQIYKGGILMGEGVDDYFKKSEKWSEKLGDLPESELLALGLLPIVDREDWGAETPKKNFHQFTHPIKYVILADFSEPCLTSADCVSAMKSEQLFGLDAYGDIPENFYIGNDGLAYEGRGWDSASFFFLPELNKEFIFVSLFGQFEKSSVSKVAVLALFRLLDHGVKMGKLDEDYKVTTVGRIMNSTTTGNFDDDIRDWNHWTDDVKFFFDIGATPSGLLLVDRDQWKAKYPKTMREISEFPLTHVVVHDTGDRCECLADCMSSVKKLQDNLPLRVWDVEDNYYVGEDGHIFEGRGLQSASHWHTVGIENKFISIGFLGSFQSTPPLKSYTAFQFFTKAMVRTGKLSPDFKIVSLGHILNDRSLVGETLIETMKKQKEHWSESPILSYDVARLASHEGPLVLTEEWQLSGPAMRRENALIKPLNYVVIRDGGKPCGSYDTCVEFMQSQQTNGTVSENFYIGNDGLVYEAVGWDWDTKWAFQEWKSSVTVQFIGTYQHELPSEKALDVFRSLLQIGVETEKLSHDYKIRVVTEMPLGDRLKNEIFTWDRFHKDTEEGK